MSESKLKADHKSAVAEQEAREGVEIMSAHEYAAMVKTYEDQHKAGRGFKGKVNLYTCETCGTVTIYRDVDAGVTPFAIGCTVEDCNSTKYPGAKSMCQSSMYRVQENQNAKMREEMQWYRPSYLEYTTLTPYQRDHVNRGGLLPRKALHNG